MKTVMLLVGIALVGGALANETNQSLTQDLQGIKKAADDFLQTENARQKTHFVAADLNPKIIVEGCPVPLQTAWAKPSDGQSQKSVLVTCPATPHDKKGWRVFVPVAASVSLSRPLKYHQ